MNFTPEQKAQWLDAAQALLAGEPVEYRFGKRWYSTNSVSMGLPHRRKPAPDPLPTPPRMIPLTREDVPPGSALRYIHGEKNGTYCMAIRVNKTGVLLDVSGTERLHHYSFARLKNICEILRPGDTKWRRCEKPEAKP